MSFCGLNDSRDWRIFAASKRGGKAPNCGGGPSMLSVFAKGLNGIEFNEGRFFGIKGLAARDDCIMLTGPASDSNLVCSG